MRRFLQTPMVCCLICSSLFQARVFGDDPKQANKKEADPLFPYTVSKETTRFTKPLHADGSVNFAAALREKFSEGVTAENNAAVLLMQAFGSEGIPEPQRETFFKKLGVAVPDSSTGTMKNIGEFASEHLEANRELTDLNQARDQLFDQQLQANKNPWARKEFPTIAKWLDANAKTLELATQASKKSRIFIPMIADENEPLLASPISSVMNLRDVARMLCARAMLAVEEGRLQDAQNDLLVCHRLARLLGQQPTLIEALVSYTLDAKAYLADFVMLESRKISKDQLAAYRGELAKLAPLPRMSEKIDEGERFFFLDAVSKLATQRLNGKDVGIPDSKMMKKLLGLSIDWDLIMKRGNQEYDKLVASLNLPTHAARQAEMLKHEAELKKLAAEANSPAQYALMFLGVDPPRAVISRNMSNILIALLLPSVRQASIAETRAQTQRDLTLLAFALREYQIENGNYPEKLSGLSPGILKTLPQDLFTAKPLRYQRTADGYLLHSLGANGQDDKGQSDDVSLQVPRQPEL